MAASLIQYEFLKVYNQYWIKIVFFLVFMTNILINVDHGTMPGGSDQIMKDLEINEL